MSADGTQTPHPVEVSIKNWADATPKPALIRNTNVRNVVLTTDNSLDGTSFNISTYEPSRARILIIPIDSAIALLDHPPNNPTGQSSVTAKPEGAVLPVTTVGFELFGPDAFWIQNLGTNTRVTIIKEYYYPA